MPYPKVFITDGDRQLTDALDEFFPNVQRQRCVWHLNCNLIANIKKLWVKDRRIDFDPRPLWWESWKSTFENTCSVVSVLLRIVGSLPANGSVSSYYTNRKYSLYLGN